MEQGKMGAWEGTWGFGSIINKVYCEEFFSPDVKQGFTKWDQNVSLEESPVLWEISTWVPCCLLIVKMGSHQES